MTESFKRINPENLDEENVLQPEMLDYFGKALAGAHDEAKRAKHYLAEVEAIISENIRLEHSAAKSKLTEAGLKGKTVIHPNYKLALEIYLTCTADLSRKQLAYDAVKARGGSIDNLVKIFLAGYYGHLDPIETHDHRTKALEKRMMEITQEMDIPVKKVPRG